MFDRFTEPALKLILRAQDEAYQQTTSFVGTEHLLIGSMLLEGQACSEILKWSGCSAHLLRESIFAITGRHAYIDGKPIELPFTPKVKSVIGELNRLAVDEDRYVTTVDLLLGIVGSEGVARQALLKMEIDVNALEQHCRARRHACETSTNTAVLINPKQLKEDVQDVLEGLRQSNPHQHVAWVIRGTDVHRFLVTQEEKESWDRKPIKYFENEDEAKHTLVNTLAQRIVELTTGGV